MPYVLLLLFLILMVMVVLNIKIVPQATVFVVERMGAYQATWETGVHFTIPFVDRVAKKVSLKEQVVDFNPQPVITKDNVTMQIDTVVFYQITDEMCIRDSRGAGRQLRGFYHRAVSGGDGGHQRRHSQLEGVIPRGEDQGRAIGDLLNPPL